jgi:hypothetical protein
MGHQHWAAQAAHKREWQEKIDLEIKILPQ